MESTHDHRPESVAYQPAMRTQAELEATFDADEADVAASRVVPLEPVLARMRAIAARIRRERELKEAATPRCA